MMWNLRFAERQTNLKSSSFDTFRFNVFIYWNLTMNCEELDGLIAQEEKLIYLLDINGSMVNDQLVVSWVYSKKIYKRQTIEDLAQGFMRALQNLMTHCQSPQTGGYTPSDFPLSRLSQIELDRLVGRGENIADVYPLSPMQSGMLFHSLYAPDSGDYFIQNIFEVSGNFDKQRFKQTWQQNYFGRLYSCRNLFIV